MQVGGVIRERKLGDCLPTPVNSDSPGGYWLQDSFIWQADFGKVVFRSYSFFCTSF